MIKKRILCFCLAAAMLLCMLPSAFAADGPRLSLSSGSVDPGGSVTLTVSVADNPGMATCMLYFYYDTDVFAVDPDTDISVAADFSAVTGAIGSTIDAAKASGRYDGKAGMDGSVALLYTSSGMDTTKNGRCLNIRFHAAQDAQPGAYEIALGYGPRNNLNQSGEKLIPTLSGGTITVNGSGSGTVIPTTPETPKSPVFSDVAGTWAESFILRAAEQGLIEGFPDGTYQPGSTMTRAQLVTILWRAAGSPKPTKKASFPDLPDAWYQDAVAWAEENGVVNGMPDGTFQPRGNVTRQQLAVILHRLCGTPKGMEAFFASTYDSLFTDSKKVHDWARDAVYWALYKEIYCGVGAADPGKTLDPLADADRSQIAVMIVRYLDKY